MSIARKISQWTPPNLADATDLFGIAESLKAHYEKSGYYTKAIRDADYVFRKARREFETLAAHTHKKAVGTVQDKKYAIVLDPACAEAQERMDDAEVELNYAKDLKKDYELRVSILQTLKGIAHVLASLSGLDGERPMPWNR
ncbi:MAG: hypothetical protein WAN89_02840 [Lawsonella sp.]